jgi:hypothetical protein
VTGAIEQASNGTWNFRDELDPDRPPAITIGKWGGAAYQVRAYVCAKCGEKSVYLQHYDMKMTDRARIVSQEVELISIRPLHGERIPPKEVPPEIAKDYREATRIMDLSPAGASTLARRCLQASLRHAYPDMPRGMNLQPEAEWVRNHKELPAEVIEALFALKDLATFGAHPAEDGLTVVYELSRDDLDDCIHLLDTLFEILYVAPARTAERLRNLRQRVPEQVKAKPPGPGGQATSQT